MAVFFGKFADKFPDQIKNGFYRTNRPEMFGDLQPQDIVYAIGNHKIQLWRALEFENVGEEKQMNFEIISNDLKISIPQLPILKFFRINSDLVVHTIRQSAKAFFQIDIIGINQEDLLNLDLYRDKNNYRSCHFVESKEQIDHTLIEKDIFFYKESEWHLFSADFIETSIITNFRDNTSYIGKGRPNKDKTLKKINSASLPFIFDHNEIKLLDIYDAFLCDYSPKEVSNGKTLPLNIFPHKIFKLSQGKDFVLEEHNLLLEKGLVSVHKDTPAKGISSVAQGQSFIKAKVGDYFYLCKGNDFMELIGQFTSDARPSDKELFDDPNWYVRDFKVIAKSTKKGKYNGSAKWWTPNDNSTFIEIPQNEFSLANKELLNPFFSISVFSSESDHQMNNIVNLLESKKQIILQGAPGTGKTYATAEIALKAIGKTDVDFANREEVMQAYHEAVKEGQIAFTTFHQSLDYEEFIEGIKPNSENGKITYDVIPGIFREMCKKAIQKDSLNELQAAIEKFKDECSSDGDDIILETKEKNKFVVFYRGGITFRIRPVESAAEEGKDYGANIEQIEKLYKREEKGIYGKSYVWGILNYLKNKYKIGEHKSDQGADKKYVLIIDEINRGNISKIFGELITLLEADKRLGKTNKITCHLPYSGDEFGVPENLYIIGTMNTTDRSLGHVDYAVRRRFGFVTLESDKQKVADFHSNNQALQTRAVNLFEKVEKLVKENTSPEFQSKDIMVGHSYFMAENEEDLNLKLQYEIKPLLCEYIKDGLLALSLNDIEEKIDKIAL